MSEELDLVSVGVAVVEVAGRVAGRQQDQYQFQSAHLAELQTHYHGGSHGNTREVEGVRGRIGLVGH